MSGWLVRWMFSLLVLLLVGGFAVDAAGATPKIVAGEEHSLLLRADGTLWAWGNDSYGQLGQDRLVQSPTPIPVRGLPAIKKFASASGHNLALSREGVVWAWGTNRHGQLGDGGTSERATPVAISGLSGVSTLAVGYAHSLALKADGTVWAWGSNSSGQLGDASMTDRHAPVQVSGLSGVVEIAAGIAFSLARKSDGTVWAWGNDTSGQLGDGYSYNHSTPVQIEGLSGVKGIAAGGHPKYFRVDGSVQDDDGFGLALMNDGSVWAWGVNSFGQLGDGTQKSYPSLPAPVKGLSGVAAVAAGNSHSLALKSDGTVWAWGWNGYGQLGDGTLEIRATPVRSAGLSGVTAVAASQGHSLALTGSGVAWAWGSNFFGELGDASNTARVVPVQVLGLSGTVALAAGFWHNLALNERGEVFGWGSNQSSQLGEGSETSRPLPLQVQKVTDVAGVAAGTNHNLALKNDGRVVAWGENTFGALGDGSIANRSAPVQVAGLSGVTQLAAGNSYSLALRSDGAVWAWGQNYYCQLGDGGYANRTLAAPIVGLTGVKAIAARGTHGLALKEDGTVWAWGYYGDTRFFELLLGCAGTPASLPAQVVGLSNIVAVAEGKLHSAALSNDGSVWVWGLSNLYGQLGDGGKDGSIVPKQVQGLPKVAALAAGGNFTLARAVDGSVWGWGDSSQGELGDGSNEVRPTPIQLSPFAKAVLLAAGGAHSLALKDDGSVLATGKNDWGQLGDATLAQRHAPVLVVDTSANGFFNANVGSTSKVPPVLDVPFFVVAQGSVSGTSASVKATTKFNPSDTGKSGAVYVTAMVPSGSLGTTSIGASPAKDIFASQPPQLTATPACPAAANPLTLIQLTPSGWQTVVNGQLIPYASGVLGDQLAAQTILNGTDTTNLKGAEFCVGYGTSAQDMVNNGNIRAVATIPGATTSSSCVVGGTISVGLSVAAGWNLLGNPVNQSLGVAQKFGDASKVNTVWKWDAIKANWQFYTPSLNATDLLAYATAQGYGVLSEIQAGDGYWVHAKTQADLGSLCGQAVNLRQSSLSSGWNLVSTASPISAKEFNLALSTTPPTAGQVPVNMTSLWAWDVNQSNWYFYAPSLDAQGGSVLSDYIGAKNYRDFNSSGKTLGNGVGIWVNRP